MKKAILLILVLATVCICLSGCRKAEEPAASHDAISDEKEENSMIFKFESLTDESLIYGCHYLMDFDSSISEETAAVTEGKLLTVFGEPSSKSENYENSFNYIIRATSEYGRSVILNVYNVGQVHIGAQQSDDFTREASLALIEYVSAATPSDFERTVYYLDFNMQIDISVKNGFATIHSKQMPEEKFMELINEWYS